MSYISAAPLPTYLAVTLLTLQCIKRFYETHWVQVFSSHSKMNITHYAVGYFHYFGAFLAIISQGPGFVRQTSTAKVSVVMELNQLSALHYVAIALFMYALYKQHQCNLILANLRKNKSGKEPMMMNDDAVCQLQIENLRFVFVSGSVVNYKHVIPSGDYFHLLSAPHMFFEILMYVALQLLLLGNTSWIFVLFWVASNQIENAWLTHKWYLETFDSYKKLNRRAIIPFLL